MRASYALAALLAALSGWQTACAQGIFGLTPPRPSDLPVAPGKGPDRPLVSGSYYYYAGSSSLRSATYYVVPVGRVTVYLAPLSAASSQPVTVSGQRQNQHDREAERVPPPRPAEGEVPVVSETIAPGAPASVFRPIGPDERASVRVPAAPLPASPAQTSMPSKLQRDTAPPLREPPSIPGAPAIPAEPKA